jgi:hypothetical protein
MSMILLEPANTILYNSIEDQAADHLINGVSGNFNLPNPLARRSFPKPTSPALRISAE